MKYIVKDENIREILRERYSEYHKLLFSERELILIPFIRELLEEAKFRQCPFNKSCRCKETDCVGCEDYAKHVQELIEEAKREVAIDIYYHCFDDAHRKVTDDIPDYIKDKYIKES